MAPTLGAVMNLDIPPVVSKVLGDQSTVASVGLAFATEQDAFCESIARRCYLNAPLAHQFEKAPFVLVPRCRPFSVGIEHVTSRGETRHMKILDVTDPAQEVGRSSRFANPESCDTLFKRTSTSRFTPDNCSCSKKRSAEICVKPSVHSLIRKASVPQNQHFINVCDSSLLFCIRTSDLVLRRVE